MNGYEDDQRTRVHSGLGIRTENLLYVGVHNRADLEFEEVSKRRNSGTADECGNFQNWPMASPTYRALLLPPSPRLIPNHQVNNLIFFFMSSNFTIDKSLFARLTAAIAVAQLKARILALELQLEELQKKSASGAILEPATRPVSETALITWAKPSVQSHNSSLASGSSKATYAQVLKSPFGSSKTLAGITESQCISISSSKNYINIILAFHPQFIPSNISALSLYSKSSVISTAPAVPSLALYSIVIGPPTLVCSAKKSDHSKIVDTLSKPSEAISPNIIELDSSNTSGMCL